MGPTPYYKDPIRVIHSIAIEVQSVNENLQSITTSQVAKRHFAQNLEMMRSGESSIPLNFVPIQERVMRERHTCWNNRAKGYVVPQSNEEVLGSKSTYHCFAKQGLQYEIF